MVSTGRERDVRRGFEEALNIQAVDAFVLPSGAASR
jgi:hypothetical protein